MPAFVDAHKTPGFSKNHVSSAIRSIGILLLMVAAMPALAAHAASSPPVKIAVFDFELEDVSPAASATGATASYSTRMQAVTAAARRVVAELGRYSLVDINGVDAEPVRQRSLRNCSGCDAGIALKLGAEQSLVGVVTRVTNTDYYVSVRITDTSTGEIINQQTAFFTGADDAWASGVAFLIRHGVLAHPDN